MPRNAGKLPIFTMMAIAAWRVVSELVVRRRALASTGELARRIDARRSARVERALVHAHVRVPVVDALVPTRIVRVPVPVSAGWGSVVPAPGIHASVQVGSIHGSDLDDVGLLEAAMRRAAHQRALVTQVDDRSDAHSTDWGGMLEDGGAVDRARRVVVALGAIPLLAIVLGVCLTFVPLVRPLDDVAPWLALGGLALVVAGVVAARWSDDHSSGDGDGE